jgi:hypothetical protein
MEMLHTIEPKALLTTILDLSRDSLAVLQKLALSIATPTSVKTARTPYPMMAGQLPEKFHPKKMFRLEKWGNTIAAARPARLLPTPLS